MRRIAFVAGLFCLFLFLGWYTKPAAKESALLPLAATATGPIASAPLAPRPARVDANGHLGAYEFTEISRLQKLKKMQDEADLGPPQENLKIYRRILADKNESWVIQRQALQNALRLSRYLSDRERETLIASVSPALLLQANKTEEELIAEFLAHAKR